MQVLKIDGLTVTIEGTWYEISNGVEVVAYGNVYEGVTPEDLYRYYKKGVLQ